MIGFKEGRDRAIHLIEAEVETAAQIASMNLKGHQMNDALAKIIAAAVTAGIKALVDQQYTDQDFENDVLK